MKLAAQRLAAPNDSHTKIDRIAVAVKLNMRSQPNATMKGRPCETA